MYGIAKSSVRISFLDTLLTRPLNFFVALTSRFSRGIQVCLAFSRRDPQSRQAQPITETPPSSLAQVLVFFSTSKRQQQPSYQSASNPKTRLYFFSPSHLKCFTTHLSTCGRPSINLSLPINIVDILRPTCTSTFPPTLSSPWVIPHLMYVSNRHMSLRSFIIASLRLIFRLQDAIIHVLYRVVLTLNQIPTPNLHSLGIPNY